MAHPVEPNFGRHGEYSTGRTAVEAFRQGSFVHPGNMYHGNGAPQQPLNFWQKVIMRADTIRDAMGDKCCRCLHHMPSLVLIIGILLIIGLAIAAVPIAFIIISNTGGTSEAQNGDLRDATGVFFQPIRHGFSEWPEYNEEIDKVQDMDDLKVFSASALFPPNVSLCHGFGFACTSQPSIVISSTQRCDGKADCSDGSDELNCRECQTPFWCEKGSHSSDEKARVRQCLRASDLCDGKPQCADGVDETAYCRKSADVCEKGTMRCSGTPLCLPEEAVCDGEMDCMNDDDEKQCSTCKRGAKICAATKRCIPRSQLCNGVVDCPDGSDEMDCDCMSCSGTDRALCSNGRCVERSKVCDGTIDCQGGLDEQDCPGTCRAPAVGSNSSTSAFDGKTVMCADGRHYHESEACAGHIRACAKSCPKCDARLAFQCRDGTCIQKMRVCDGSPDCDDGEDELACKDACSRAPNFKCTKGGKCVPQDAKCNGVRDCEDGSDEQQCDKCPSDSFHCVKDRTCFPLLARCDGTPDCSDASDEADCSCEDCTSARSDTYSCEKSKRCFKRESVCSPYSECPEATHADKLFCAAKSLEGRFP